MNLVIAAAIDADYFTPQFLYLFGRTLLGFTIPEVLRPDHGDADSFPLK